MNQNATTGSSFLLEIGTEDLPARFVPPALRQMEENAREILRGSHIRFSEIKTYGTPRRLVVVVEGIPPMQEDRTREVFGPSRKVAFDDKGNPTKAAMGFARSQGVSVDSLAIGNKDKGEYIVAIIEEKGLRVREILPEICRKLVLSIRLPKAMRWGDKSIKFVRPIRWLMSLFDKEAIDFEIDGIRSSNLTRGHRFLSPAAFQLKEIPSYRKLLANNHVIVDHEERKKIILSRAEKLLTPSGERIIEDSELLDTVADLLEYPVPVLGTFSESYLILPKELLITVMKGHQKYFAVEDPAGKITNRFIVVSNTSEENSETVRVGAERVIRARFEDARFYFDEDRSKRLSERVEDLGKVTFQENLGNLYEKTGRVAFVAEFLADRLMPAARTGITRAAQLAKTDLITGVVREFPELQGVMGKYYALLDGEDEKVAVALEEHYLPTHAGGRLPETDEGALLAIADRIDNIVSFFSIGLTPTGSEDPFAHRRQALAIIAIIRSKGYRLPLRTLIDKALEALPDVKDAAGTREKVSQFFETRLETVFADLGYDPDLIQSVLPLSLVLDLGEIGDRLEAIKRSRGDNFDDFIAAAKRVYNIKSGAAVAGLNADLLIEASEKKLKEELDGVRARIGRLLDERKHGEAVALLFSLTEPINEFFDRVLVMDKREEIKLNRLALLNGIWETISGVADFSKLSAQEG